MEIAQLKSIVLREVAQVENTKFRCHEIARIFVKKLCSLGLKARATDGLVLYNVAWLRRNFLSGFDGFSSEEMCKCLESKKGDRLLVIHSWCEINEDGKTIVIDHHHVLRLSDYEIYTNCLFVGYRSQSPHEYHPVGRKIGRFIIFPTPRFLRIVRLRI